MRKVKWLGLFVFGIALGVTAIVAAQPTIAEMKWLFYDTYAKLVYDANPNTVGNTTLIQYDGSNAVVAVTGSFMASGGIDAVYSDSFTPSGAVTPSLLTVAGLVQSAAAQQLDIGYFENGHKFIFGQSTAQTILPVMDAVGLDIGGDQVSAEAYEMFAGVLGATGRPLVVGVDPAFYFCAAVTPVDASGASDLHIGFRTATQTQTATLGTYLNFATIGLEGTSNPNVIQIMTSDDDAETTTDTTQTWADGVNIRLCTIVSAAGVVTYTNGGAAPTVTAAFTFDDGDMLIPFIHFQHGADVAGAVDVTEWTVGWVNNAGSLP